MKTHLKQLAIDIFEIAQTHSEITHCLDNPGAGVCNVTDYVTDTILEIFENSEIIKPFIVDSGIPYNEFIEIPDETDQSLRDYIRNMVDHQ